MAGPLRTPPNGAYRRWIFRAPPEAEELVVAELWAMGTLGVQTVEEGAAVRIEAYFAAASGEAGRAATTDWRALGVESVASEAVATADWLAEYRRLAQPFDLGRGFRVDPSDLPPGPPPRSALEGGARRSLYIPARTAFGTGTHPSTRLAVELLEAQPPAGLDLLDVGTGTGILAMVAVALGARRAVGLEIDLEAVWVARVNQRVNRLPVHLVAGGPEALVDQGPFGAVVVNMTLGNLRRCLEPLRRALRAGCRAIVSGSLAEQAEELTGLLEAAGFELLAENREEEGWIACRALYRPR